MKIVDLRKKDGGVNPKYLNVPQPMYIFHSKEELITYIRKNELKTFHIIKNVADFVAFTKKYNLQGHNKYSQLSEINVFVATDEKFVPDTLTSKGAERGIIKWKLDEEGRAIPTDGCFIQLHLLFSARNHYLCFFSNGVELLSLSKWNITAALKDQFQRPSGAYESPEDRSTYDSRLKETLQRRKVTVRDVRLFHILFNPLSDVYLNVDEAVLKVYGRTIRKADREKVVQTERFRKLFRKEIGILMGDLKQAFKTEISDKKMVEMAQQIFTKSIETGSTDDSLKVYDAILGIRESEENIPATVDAKLITGKKADELGGDKKGFALPDAEKDKDEVEIELLDEIPEIEKPPEIIKEEVSEFTMVKAPHELSEAEKIEKEKQLDALRKDTDALDYQKLSELSKLNDL